MNNDEIMEQAYNDYFSGVNKKNKDNYKNAITQKKENYNKTLSTKLDYKYHADGRINNIDEFAMLLSEIIKLATGDSIVFKPAYSKSEKLGDEENLPIVTYDINNREISENCQLKPQLTDSFPEVINGQKTGESIQVYRQWFDCLVEFDSYGTNGLEARRTLDTIEEILNLYAGHFKKAGVSEMFFVKEIPSKRSVNYIRDVAMKSIIWYVKIEKIYISKSSVINKIDVNLNDIVKKIKSENFSV